MRSRYAPGVVIAFILGVLALGAPDFISAQEVGAVTGEVRDAATRQPLSGVQISVEGTDYGTLTNARGRFVLANLPAGSVTVVAERIGYGSDRQAVDVPPGETVNLRFQLAETAIALDEVVVQALTGETRRRRELANAVARVDADVLERASVASVTDVLTGRLSGVELQRGTGASGTGAAIRIRGANSLSLSNEPLIIVDGIRYSNSNQVAGLIQEGGQPSRLNDLNTDEVESVEVLKGPAASGLYGTAAANGVIVITTKRGGAGDTRISGYAETGTVRNVHPGLPSFAAATRESGALVPSGCLLVEHAAGTCNQEEIVQFNALTDPRTTPYRDGSRQNYGLSVSGGAEGITYFVSGGFEEEKGVFNTSGLQKTNVRGNLGFALRDNLTIDVSSGFVSSDLALPSNHNSSYGYLFNAVGGRAFFDPDDPSSVFNQYSPEGTTNHLRGTQEIRRSTGSANVAWRPLEWLRGNVTAGTDLVNFHNLHHYPPNVLRGSAEFGSRRSTRGTEQLFNANASLTSVFSPTDWSESTTTAGVDYTREHLTSSTARAAGLLEGTETLQAASRDFGVSEGFSEIITLGWFAQQQVAAGDRLFVTLGFRGDDNSAFGSDFGLVVYPSFGASWVISEESFFPTQPVLSTLRLRTSYGRSGLRPGFRQALTYFTPTSVMRDGEVVNAVSIGGTGHPGLQPEKVDEFELGADIGLLDGRANLDVTFFNKRSTDALIARRLPPSLGLSPFRFDNLGEVENRGVEVGLDGRLLQTAPVQWDMRVSFSTLRNRINDLGEGIPPIVFHPDAIQRHQEGFPAGGWWARPLEYNDINGDGILSHEEVQVGDTAVFLGPSIPTLQGSVSSSLTLFDNVTVSGLLEGRSGHKQYNRTELFRCLQGMSSPDRGCQGMWDPDASLSQQAAFIGLYTEGTRAGFLEDGSFLRLRELQVTLEAPAAWSDGLGIQRLRLSLAGRNLGTWTRYSGMDVEGNLLFGEQGGLHNFPTGDLLIQPPVRYWTARVNFDL